MKPWTLPKPSWLRQPAADDAADDADDDRSAGSPGGLRRRPAQPEIAPGEEADDDPADDVHVSMARSLARWQVRSRNASTAATNRRRVGVVRRVPRPVDDDDAAVGEPRIERVGRGRKTGRLAPPRICSTGWRTAPSASSEAAGETSGVELADDRAGGRGPAAARPGPPGSAARSASTCRRPRVMNVARAPSGSPAASRSRTRSSSPAGW